MNDIDKFTASVAPKPKHGQIRQYEAEIRELIASGYSYTQVLEFLLTLKKLEVSRGTLANLLKKDQK